MLSLASTTGRAWVERACAHLDEILLDHAHCEKKAASTAVSLRFKYAERRELLVTLSQLAREELGHFEQVLAELAARGVAFRHQVPSPYAGQLMKAIRAREPERLVDTLLCSALIEARSCERMRLLAQALDDPALARLYRGLLAAEARRPESYLHLPTAVAHDGRVRNALRRSA